MDAFVSLACSQAPRIAPTQLPDSLLALLREFCDESIAGFQSAMNLKQVFMRLLSEPTNAKLRRMRTDVFAKVLFSNDNLVQLMPVLAFVGFQMDGELLVLAPEETLGNCKAVCNFLEIREAEERDPDTFSLSEVMHFVQQDLKLPGILQVPESTSSGLNEAEKTIRPRKPWERETGITVDFESELAALQETLQERSSTQDGTEYSVDNLFSGGHSDGEIAAEIARELEVELGDEFGEAALQKAVDEMEKEMQSRITFEEALAG